MDYLYLVNVIIIVETVMRTLILVKNVKQVFGNIILFALLIHVLIKYLICQLKPTNQALVKLSSQPQIIK